MKKNIQFLIVTFIFIAAGSLVGCKKMDYTYRQFIEDGETIYIAKADSIKFGGGNQRGELSWLLLSDPKVHEYKVYWNNRRDSVKNLVQKTLEIDTVKILIEDLDEGSYEFEIFMFDKLGNSSVKATKIGKVFGQRFLNRLSNRTFVSLRRMNNGNDVEITWLPAQDQLIFSEIQFTDDNNNLIRHIVEKSAKKDTLVNFPIGETFDMKSAFLPDSLAIDTFYSPIQKSEIIL